MTFFVASSIFVPLVSVLIYAVLFIGHRGRNYPPGPPTVPFIGNVHQIPKKGAHFKFTEWAHKYGGIFSLKLGSGTAIVLTDRRLVRELIDKRSAIYSDRPTSYVLQKLVTKGDYLLTMNYDSEWRKMRKLIHQEFTESMCEREHIKLQNAEAIQMMRDFVTEPEKYMLHPKRFSNSIIMSILYGLRTPTVHTSHMERFYEAMDHFSQVMEVGATPPVDFYPFLKYIPERLLGNWVSRATEVHHEMHGLYGDLINIVKKRRQEQGSKDSFMDRVLDRQEKLDLTEHQLWLLGGVAMDGGSDTSSAAILSFTKAMTCYPDVQKQAQAEIDGLMDANRSPVWSDYKDLPYVSTVVKETMRWRPVGGLIPLMRHQKLLTNFIDDWIDGKFVPKGTIVFVNVWGLHQDGTKFPDPDRFDPARYSGRTLLASEYAASPDFDSRDHYIYGKELILEIATISINIRIHHGFPEDSPLIIDNKPVHPETSPVVTNTSSNLKAEYVKYVSATPEDAIAAVESSQVAFRSWSQSLPRTRRTILQKTAALIRENTAELMKLQMEETNCPEAWAAFNVNLAALHLEEIAGRITTVLTGDIPVIQTPGQMGFVYKRPLGPILSIPPWNGAIVLATRAIDTPIAVGCTVVLKASEQSPNTHHFLAELFRRAGLPPGVLNVIQTRREEAAAVTEAVISHRHIRKIEFIGSAAVGSRIGALAGKYLKPTIMELGGKAAALVLEDADLELAAQACVHGGFMHSGQICFSTERIIVNSAVAGKFIPMLTKAAAGFPIMESISPTGSNNTLRMLQDAVSKGAKVVYGEVKLLNPTRLQPVILSGLKPDMDIYDNESFGPVLAVYTVENDEEAIELANSTKYGLSAAVHSKDISRAMRVASRLEVGQTHINFPLGTGMDEATLAVGLSKASGWVKQNGSYGLDEFLELRTVTVTDPVEFAAGMAAQASQ